MKLQHIILGLCVIGSLTACKKKGCTDPMANNYNPEAKRDDGNCVYDDNGGNTPPDPTPADLDIPTLFAQYLPAPVIPADNPQTVEGIALGKRLFYDPILSANGTQACADCHAQAFSFTDSARFSTGIDNIKGGRNSMPIINAAWNFNEKFFWDGRASSLEEQAFGPVVNPIEMHNTWPNAVAALQGHPDYPNLFYKAFGTSTIDSVLVSKAIAQFERTLIAGNSKMDRYLRYEITLNDAEMRGYLLFMDEQKGDCFHCHGAPGNPLWTDNDFHNNGLDAVFADKGLEDVTGNPADRGKFKTPTLRQLAFTAPYMHDGRFQTLDQVLDHYSEGLVNSPTIDPLMKSVQYGGVGLTATEKADLKAFLLALTDSSMVTNPDFQEP